MTVLLSSLSCLVGSDNLTFLAPPFSLLPAPPSLVSLTLSCPSPVLALRLPFSCQSPWLASLALLFAMFACLIFPTCSCRSPCSPFISTTLFTLFIFITPDHRTHYSSAILLVTLFPDAPMSNIDVLPILLSNEICVDAKDGQGYISTYYLNRSYDFEEICSPASIKHPADIGTKYLVCYSYDIANVVRMFSHLTLPKLINISEAHGIPVARLRKPELN